MQREEKCLFFQLDSACSNKKRLPRADEQALGREKEQKIRKMPPSVEASGSGVVRRNE